MERILRFYFNGEAKTILIHDNSILLDVIRDNLGFQGTKKACGYGECGACTIIMDNKAVNSCMILAAEAEGSYIETVEGLMENGQLNRLQQAFIEEGAVQCGFCTPGMLMSATALLRENENPSEEDIKSALAGNICRCTGYKKIVRAIQSCVDDK